MRNGVVISLLYSLLSVLLRYSTGPSAEPEFREVLGAGQTPALLQLHRGLC